MSKKLDVIGVGYPSLDYIIALNDNPSSGKTSIIKSHDGNTPYYGGCVVNITYLLTNMGYDCGLSMTVGSDFKESGFEKFLLNKGVSIDYVVKNRSYNTSYTKLLMTPDQEHITLFYPGPMVKKEWKPQNFEKLKSKYGLLTVGEINSNKQFLNACIEKNIPTIFSMKGDYHSLEKEYLISSLKNSEVIFMNETEYEHLNEYLPTKILDHFKNDNLKVVVITLGSKGSIVVGKQDQYYVPSYTDAKVVDTSGGGDAFIAGFLSKYLKNESLENAAVCGTALASFIIEDFGCLTNIPSKKDLEFREKKIKERINYEKSNVILRTYRR